MTDRFCGNPRNHDAHEYSYSVDEALPDLTAWCDSVGIQPFDSVTEKYDPTEQAEDGTPYSEITIRIKDADGNVTEIHCDKASFMQFDVETQKYVPLERDFEPPRIERGIFSFVPYQYGEHGITIHHSN